MKFEHLKRIMRMGKPQKNEILRKDEYVINDQDDPKTQIKKSMKR